jgi:hypothetical protein
MSSELLQSALHAQPFEPFAFRFRGGRFLKVTTPDVVAHKPGGRVVIIIRDDESYEAIDLAAVEGLDFDEVRKVRRDGTRWT